MKKYIVIKFIFSGSSNIQKYESDCIEDCRTMRELLIKQDQDSADQYKILEVVE